MHRRKGLTKPSARGCRSSDDKTKINTLKFKIMATKFFLCTTCGNVVVKVVDSGVIPVCCGSEMTELIPGIVDKFKEKHLPVVERVDDCTLRVKVGAEPHPMTAEHHIRFICLETEHGFQIRYLKDNEAAEVCFCGCKDKPVAVYEYCNIHGLWKTDIKGKFDDLGCCSTEKKSGKACCKK